MIVAPNSPTPRANASAAPAPTAAIASAYTARRRYVTIQAGQLRPWLLRPGRAIGLNLFADANYVGVVDRVGTEGGWVAWTGHLRGIPYSYFYVVRTSGIYTLHVGSPRGVYEVSWVRGEIYRIVQLGRTPQD
jgi:hypothetical protein